MKPHILLTEYKASNDLSCALARILKVGFYG